jgi:hypothetical protein
MAHTITSPSTYGCLRGLDMGPSIRSSRGKDQSREVVTISGRRMPPVILRVALGPANETLDREGLCGELFYYGVFLFVLGLTWRVRCSGDDGWGAAPHSGIKRRSRACVGDM